MVNDLIVPNEIKDLLVKDRRTIVDFIQRSTSAIADIQTTHRFVDGMYYRSMKAPAGSLIVGATHKKSCINILISGEIMISNGSECVRMKAPQTFEGTKDTGKTGFAITDIEWVNIFRTDALTVRDAETELFEEEPMDSQIASDYLQMLNDIGMTEEEVQEYVHLDNVIETESDLYEKKPSLVHGVGIFAKVDFKAGDVIGPGSLNGTHRTSLGRWTNHSKMNNAKFYYYKDGNVVMVAERDILANTEILLDYRDTMIEKRRTLCQDG